MRLVGDVSVDITDDTDPVTVDANYAYIVTVRNAGPNAGPVTVIVTLSSGGVNSLTATGGGICDLTITPFKCEFASLASGAAATITAATSVGILPETQVRRRWRSRRVDPDASNNQANTATLVRLVADASVEIAGSADPVTVGAAITYTATVCNLGPGNGRMYCRCRSPGLR